MGPEMTPEQRVSVSEDLELAVTCLKRAMHGMKATSETTDEPNVICTLQQITGALERCMENNRVLNDVLSGKIKCTTCGSTSVGFLSDCHDSATSTTISHRSSEEPRKTSSRDGGEDEELDEVCSSIGSRSVRSVSSNQEMEEDEVKREIKREKTTEDEEHDLVMKTILSTTSTSAEVPIVLKEEIKEEAPDANFDMILKNALGLSPDILSPENLMKGMVESHVELPEENEDKDQTQLLNNFFKILFANGGNPSSILDGSTDGTDSTGSSQPSPPADPTNFDSFAMIESLLSDSINQSESSPSEASAAAAAAAAARKRKSTPMKVPKSDDGAGYKCPMEGCNKIFKEKGSVHRHFVTHIGMRFNCDKCKASYTQKHALMLHQKIHANPDAYQCRGCGTNYTTQNGLRLHRQRNPACMEQNNSSASMVVDFNSSLSDVLSLSTNSTPTKQMVAAP